MTTFKERYTYTKRLDDARKIKKLYPNRVPIIIENGDYFVATLEKNKYLVEETSTMSNLLFVIRKRLCIKPEQAIFLFIGGKHLIPNSMDMRQVYDKYQDLDQYLYVKIYSENVFG